MPRGVVVWFNDKKGFGFIHPEDGGRDIFLHRTVLEGIVGYRTISEGTPVEFEVIDEGKGPRAAHVRLAPPAKLRGIVQWFDDEKGVGFICGTGTRDIFFHRSDIVVEHGPQTLTARQAVIYEIVTSEKGPRVANVRAVTPSTSAPIPPAPVPASPRESVPAPSRALAPAPPVAPPIAPRPEQSHPLKRICKTYQPDEPPFFEKVNEIIRRDFSKPDLQVKKLAKQFGISPWHFSMVYHKQAGKTFQEALLECRMDRAKELMKGNLDNREITIVLGLKDHKYFAKRFRQFHGVSPRKYRVNLRAEACERKESTPLSQEQATAIPSRGNGDPPARPGANAIAKKAGVPVPTPSRNGGKRKAARPLSEEPPKTDESASRRIKQKVDEILLREFPKSIRGDELAKRIGMARGHLSVTYSRESGKTITETILERQMEFAKDLLQKTDIPISQVAKRSGYSEQSHFAKRFRNYQGLSPRAYREQAQGVGARQPRRRRSARKK